MPLDLPNILQTLLLPLALGAVVVAGLLLDRLRRKPVRPPADPAATTMVTTAVNTRAAVRAPKRRATTLTPVATPVATPATTAAATGAATPATRPRPVAAAPALALRADLLLVDDSAVVRAKLRRLFEPAGYRVALAHDGEAALALLREGRYAVLITDLEMPKLDGLGLIRAALALPACAGMPILAITGHEDLQSQLNQLGAVAGIYRKPWSDETLLDDVQALAKPSMRAAEPVLEA